MRKLLFIPVLAVLITVLSLMPQDAHASVTMDLKDQASCQAAPLSGTWIGTNSTCRITNLTINGGDSLSIDNSVYLGLDLTISGTLNNYGGITILSTCSNGSNTACVSIAGTITNEGTINNQDEIAISGLNQNNTGGIDNYGIINNYRTIDSYSTINNYGTINNDAVINNSGTFADQCNGVLYNYRGDGKITGNPIVNIHCTTTTITPNPSWQGISSTRTYSVTVSDTTSSPTTPTGTVSWSDGGAGGTFSSTSCTLASSSSSAGTCSTVYTAPTSTGKVTLTATYSGDASHQASSGSIVITITLRATTTSVTPNPSFVVLGNTLVFTGTITDAAYPSKTSPTGTISWSDGGKGGTFTVGGVSTSTCNLSSVSSSASACNVTYQPSSTVPSGTVITITATYSGDSTHAASSGTSTLTVGPHTSSIVITPNPSWQGISSSKRYYATVTDTSSSPITPTGTVSWSDGGAGGTFSSTSSSTSCTLASSSSSAGTCSTIYTAPTSTGKVTLTATYSGDSSHGTRSSSIVITIITRATTTSVTPNPSSVTLGNTISFTGTITDAASPSTTSPTGTISWSDGGKGGTFTVGGVSTSTCNLSSVSSSASACNVTYQPSSTVPSGTVITITATYSGDSTHAASSGTSALTVS